MKQLDPRAEVLIVAVLIAFLLPSAAVELGSESLSLNSYYPSPLGIYSQLTTTGDTTLARDGGAVALAPGGGSVVVGQPATPASLTLWGSITFQGVLNMQNDITFPISPPSSTHGIWWPKGSPYLAANSRLQTRTPYLQCHRVAAVNNVYISGYLYGASVSCNSDEMLTSCLPLNNGSPGYDPAVTGWDASGYVYTVSCVPYVTNNEAGGDSCYAGCGYGEWVMATCCKVVAQ